MAKIEFNDFAERYCGTSDRAEQIEQLMDALIKDELFTNDQISKNELDKLFDTECLIEQTYFAPNDYYDILINGTWACMSLEKII